RHHASDSLRPISVQCGFISSRPASVLYSSGRTRVLCVATLEEGVPTFLLGRGRGWATAEYDILPGATLPRHQRERGGKVSGRTQEIQRLIGRSLRAVLDLEALDGFTLRFDCDVLEADGGTRTAAISGAYIAGVLAARAALRDGRLARDPFTSAVAAVSAGMVEGRPYLDLDYEEDSSAHVDLNLVLDRSLHVLEIQATAETRPLARADLDQLIDLATRGIEQIFVVQERAIETTGGAGLNRDR